MAGRPIDFKRKREHKPWMESKKPISSPCLAVPALLDKLAGRYVYSPVAWWNWAMRSRSATKPCTRCSKKRTEALVETMLVHSPRDQRSVCVAHGGCLGGLHSSL